MCVECVVCVLVLCCACVLRPASLNGQRLCGLRSPHIRFTQLTTGSLTAVPTAQCPVCRFDARTRIGVLQWLHVGLLTCNVQCDT